jgi:hypothetical protein
LNLQHGSPKFNTYFNQIFNTAAFVILSGFSTCLQTRSKKLNYGTWILNKWFGLIPISLLALLMEVPGMQHATTSHVFSLGTQLYLGVTTFLGFGWLGVAGNFEFLHNATAFNTDTAFGNVGTGLGGVLSSSYFATFLFTMMVSYVPMHSVLSYELPQKIFQSSHGLVPAMLSVGLMWASTIVVLNTNLGSLVAGQYDGLWFSGFFLFLFLLFPAGVFLAEMRCQLPPCMKSVLGHWIVVDASIITFFAYTFTPHPAVAKGQPSLLMQLTCTIQPVLFGLMLLALSCQSYHKKRSLIVFTLFERDTLLLPSVFGRCSYTFYLFQIPLINGPWMPAFVCLGDSTCTTLPPGADPAASTSYKLLTFVLALVLAVLTQWLQDTYVTAAHVEFIQLVNCDGACWALFTHEQNPLSGLVLMCYPPAVALATEATKTETGEECCEV